MESRGKKEQAEKGWIHKCKISFVKKSKRNMKRKSSYLFKR